MIKKIMIILIFCSLYSVAMEEATFLKSPFCVVIFTQKNLQHPLRVEVKSSSTVADLKNDISLIEHIPTHTMLLRALPRHSGSVASQVLEDDQLVMPLVSTYSHRFLLDKKSS